MITCSNCKASNVDGAAFCDNCGSSLTGVAAPMAGPALGGAPAMPAPAMGGGMNCPTCGAAVIAGEAFCGNCGAAITNMPAPSYAPPPAPAPVYAPPPQAMPAPMPAVGGAQKCPSCGAANPAGQAFCDNCGTPLAQAGGGVAPIVQPVAPVMGMRPRLMVAASGAVIDLAGKTQAIIGREDPVSGVFPEVDLTPHGGDAGGVSRRHARMVFNGYQWTIEDLNSTNFTFVNNQKLNPSAPQPLNHGDQVRLGKVVLTFQTM